MSSSDVSSKFPHAKPEDLEALTEPTESQTRIKTKPIAGFVSTSMLTSSEDGLFGENSKETRLTEENTNNTIHDGKTLYERLHEQQEKKDAEWKEQHNPFAPPKGLDDEEIEYLTKLENDQKKRNRKLKQQHDQDLNEFSIARKEAAEKHIHKKFKVTRQDKKTELAVPHVTIKKKVNMPKSTCKPKQHDVKVTSNVESLVVYASSDSD